MEINPACQLDISLRRHLAGSRTAKTPEGDAMMRKTMLAAAALSILAFTAQGAFAEESCSGTGTPMTKAAVESQLKAQGYTKIKEIKSHSGCYEAKGIDRNGKRFELEINSYTGKISNQEG
jgi:hypothetical protein